jgi:hypothetical protein
MITRISTDQKIFDDTQKIKKTMIIAIKCLINPWMPGFSNYLFGVCKRFLFVSSHFSEMDIKSHRKEKTPQVCCISASMEGVLS